MQRTFIFTLIVLLISACQEQPSELKPDIPEVEHPDPVTAIQKANKSFALDLFKKSSDQTDAGKNVIVAPASVSLAMSMALTGSNTETRSEMINTLGFEGLSEAQVHASNKQLIDRLVRTDTSLRLDIANAIFWDPAMVQPFPDFITTNEDHYRAELAELDFYDPQSVDIINTWVRDQTEDRIEKILENIEPDEIMFLINAMYLKADWVSPFNTDLTAENDFHPDHDQTLKAEFMNQRGDFYYTSTESYQAVDLMLADSSMSMSLIMPSEGENIQNWIANWTIDGLETMYDLFQPMDIRLIIPKFELSFHIELKQALKAMGIRLAFDLNRADFSKLGTSFGNIFLSRVEHKTYVNMDEYGVEGAAVTAVGVGTTSAPPNVLFNRPFVFIIRDVPSKSILYLGMVANPVEESD